MKTLVNKNNPAIKVVAPEIEEITTLGYTNYKISRKGMFFPLLFNTKEWTLIEEKEPIVKTIKEFVKKGKRCEQQAVEDQDYENYVFWQGFHNCAENILREVEESAEGIKGNLEEIPSNVDLEKEVQAFLCNYDYEFDDDAPAYDIARHFYELGRNTKK